MAWNVFKYCTALRALGSIMILVVIGIIGFTYYALVVANYGPSLFLGGFDSLLALLVLALFNFLLIMLLWSYFSVVVTDPGGVPPGWRPELDIEKSDGNQEYSSLTVGDSSSHIVRYCRKCNQYKPPRSHHCSVCGRCILKMDHHCVWVVNCVGAKNYKSFLLFLFYTFLETTVVAISLFPVFLVFFTDGDSDVTVSPGSLAATFVAFVLNITFALSVLGFLIMHIMLVIRNTTTIEAYEKHTAPNSPYNLGRKQNFEQVFGKDKLYWFVPLYTEDDMKRMPALRGLDFTSRRISYGSVTKLEGIQVKRLFIWVDVDEIKVDLPSTDSIYFKVGFINKKLGIDQFKTVHSCGVSGSCGSSWKSFFPGKDDFFDLIRS
ncbi:hypothetical protein DY000_02037875 [Brassica cretica]|uniref:S-acyltransferase n=1 Tax=Brassica cretica TaxID=69181 RepID=A0ABQ7BQ11_BRACR|nr:hypothetical protein DY000_02037875 [Brassica cretica]